MELELDRKMMALTTFVLVILVTTVTAYTLDKHTLNYQQQSFESNVTVLNQTDADNTTLGIDAGQKLNYGELPQETNATKSLEINSSDKVIINIDSTGNISDSLYYDRQYFQGYREVGLEYRAMEPGNYTGDVNLEIITSDNVVGDYWIRFRGDYWPFTQIVENFETNARQLQQRFM